MNEQENVQLIQQQFAAFGKGDLSAVLETIGQDVDWQSPVTRSMQEEIPGLNHVIVGRKWLNFSRNSLIRSSQKNSKYSILLPMILRFFSSWYRKYPRFL